MHMQLFCLLLNGLTLSNHTQWTERIWLVSSPRKCHDSQSSFSLKCCNVIILQKDKYALGINVKNYCVGCIAFNPHIQSNSRSTNKDFTLNMKKNIKSMDNSFGFFLHLVILSFPNIQK